jgi:hypothetical protein
MISKSELSERILELVLKEMPIEQMAHGTPEESKEYIDILTDALTAVTARMVVAYIGAATISDPDMSEDDMIMIGEVVHSRLAKHIDSEANDLMQKLLMGKGRMDA